MRRAFLLPNLFTTGNLCCGFMAVVLTMKGAYVQAAWAIGAAMVFDSLDGRVSRLTRSSSQFGVEYDSLADAISFGLAPAVLAYYAIFGGSGLYGIFTCMLYAICGTVRLARFNVRAGKSADKFFVGLPIPAAAAALAFYILIGEKYVWMEIQLLAAFYLLALSYLMVSTVTYPSFKGMGRKALVGAVPLLAAACTAFAINPQVTLFVLAFGYCMFGMVRKLVLQTRHEASDVKLKI